MSISDSVMLVKGTLSEPRMTIGPRLTPLSTFPVQLRKVRLLRATAPVSGVVWLSQSLYEDEQVSHTGVAFGCTEITQRRTYIDQYLVRKCNHSSRNSQRPNPLRILPRPFLQERS